MVIIWIMTLFIGTMSSTARRRSITAIISSRSRIQRQHQLQTQQYLEKESKNLLCFYFPSGYTSTIYNKDFICMVNYTTTARPRTSAAAVVPCFIVNVRKNVPAITTTTMAMLSTSFHQHSVENNIMRGSRLKYISKIIKPKFYNSRLFSGSSGKSSRSSSGNIIVSPSSPSSSSDTVTHYIARHDSRQNLLNILNQISMVDKENHENIATIVQKNENTHQRKKVGNAKQLLQEGEEDGTSYKTQHTMQTTTNRQSYDSNIGLGDDSKNAITIGDAILHSILMEGKLIFKSPNKQHDKRYYWEQVSRGESCPVQRSPSSKENNEVFERDMVANSSNNDIRSTKSRVVDNSIASASSSTSSIMSETEIEALSLSSPRNTGTTDSFHLLNSSSLHANNWFNEAMELLVKPSSIYSHDASQFKPNRYGIALTANTTSGGESATRLVEVTNGECQTSWKSKNCLLTPYELLALGAVWFLPASASRDPSLGTKVSRFEMCLTRFSSFFFSREK